MPDELDDLLAEADKVLGTKTPKRPRSNDPYEAALRRNGAPESLIPTMVAIGWAESSGNNRAINPGVGAGGKKTKEYSVGPWQVNTLAHPQYDKNQLTDWDYNAKAALDIYKKQGLRAWGAFTDGRYKKYLGKVQPPKTATVAPQQPDELDSLLAEADQVLGQTPQTQPVPTPRFDKQGNPVTAMGGLDTLAPTVATPEPTGEFSVRGVQKAMEALNALNASRNAGYAEYLKQSQLTDSPDARKAYNDALTLAPDAFKPNVAPDAQTQPQPAQTTPQGQLRQKTEQIKQQVAEKVAPLTGVARSQRITLAGRRPNQTFREYFDQEINRLGREAVPEATPEDVKAAQDASPTTVAGREWNADIERGYAERYASGELDAVNLNATPSFIDAIKRAVEARKKREKAQVRIDAGERDLDVLLDEGLITPEAFTTAEYERKNAEAAEEAARQKFLAENTVSDTPSNFLQGVGAARFGGGYGQTTNVGGEGRTIRPDTQSLDDVLRKYGSAQQYYKEQERIKEEYKYRYMAGPSEFVTNIARSIAAAPAFAGQAGVIAVTDLNPWLRGVTAEQNPVYQALGAYRQQLEASRNPDLDQWYLKDLPDGLGQLASQAILAPFTGGASVLLPIAQGAVTQYDEATKAGAKMRDRNIATIVGGLAAVPEVLLNLRYIGKAIPKNQFTGLLNAWSEKLFGNLAKVLPEAEARELTKRTIGAFVTQAAKNGVLGFATEMTQEGLEDIGNKATAKLTYKPEATWSDVFIPNADEKRGYFVAGLIGAFGGNVNLVVSKLSDSELKRSDEVLAEQLQKGLIEVEQAQTLAREIADEAAKRNVSLKPQGTVEQLVKGAVDRFLAENPAQRKIGTGQFETVAPIAAPETALAPTPEAVPVEETPVEAPVAELSPVPTVETAPEVSPEASLPETPQDTSLTAEPVESAPIGDELDAVLAEAETVAPTVNDEQFVKGLAVKPREIVAETPLASPRDTDIAAILTAARAENANVSDTEIQEFEESLRKADDKVFASQRNYWLKGNSLPSRAVSKVTTNTADDFQRFTNAMTPLQRGKVQKQLEKQVRYDGNTYTYRTWIESLVADGATIASTRERARITPSRRREMESEIARLRRAATEARGDERQRIKDEQLEPLVRALNDGYELREINVLRQTDGTSFGADALGVAGLDYARFLLGDAQPKVTPTVPEAQPVEAKPTKKAKEPWEMTSNEFLDQAEYDQQFRAQYVTVDGQLIKSSRINPSTIEIPPLGTWRLDRSAKYNKYGDTIEQLREIPVKKIVGAEDPKAEGREVDANRYAVWLKEGKTPPPIRAAAFRDGRYKISDGHRRVLAAQKARHKTMLAWVAPFADSDSPSSDTDLTHQIAVKQALKEGKPVPESVLSEYPDLAEKYAKKEPVKKTAKSEQVRDDVSKKAGKVDTTVTTGRDSDTFRQRMGEIINDKVKALKNVNKPVESRRSTITTPAAFVGKYGQEEYDRLAAGDITYNVPSPDVIREFLQSYPKRLKTPLDYTGELTIDPTPQKPFKKQSPIEAASMAMPHPAVESRFTLRSVLKSDGEWVATDGHWMLIVKDDVKPDKDGNSLYVPDKNGQAVRAEQNGTFPNYRAVIPLTNVHDTGKIDIQPLLDFAAETLRVGKNEYGIRRLPKGGQITSAFVVLQTPIGDIPVQSEYLTRALQSLQSLGETSVDIAVKDDHTQVLLTTPKGHRAIVMPSRGTPPYVYTVMPLDVQFNPTSAKRAIKALSVPDEYEARKRASATERDQESADWQEQYRMRKVAELEQMLDNGGEIPALPEVLIAVKQALKEGKPVPESVLSEYPDLAEKYAKKEPVKKTAKSEQVRDDVSKKAAKDHTSSQMIQDAGKQLSEQEFTALETEFEHTRTTETFWAKVRASVVSYVEKGASSVSKNIRPIIKKLVSAILAVGMIFNAGALSQGKVVQVPATRTDVIQLSIEEFAKDDAKGKPYFIVNKLAATGTVYNSAGEAVAMQPVLIGATPGDIVSPELLGKSIAETREDEKITPAGRFEAAIRHTRSADAFSITRKTPDTALDFLPGPQATWAVHRIYTYDKSRPARLASSATNDNRVSWGCVNVSDAMYDNVIAPLFKDGGVVYITPDTLSMAEVFPESVATSRRPQTVADKQKTSIRVPKARLEETDPTLTEIAKQNDKFDDEADTNEVLKSVADISEWDSEAYDKQLDGITLERNADGKILAPNGKVSKIQNERLAKVIRSKEFIEWFGPWMTEPDKASKVVFNRGSFSPSDDSILKSVASERAPVSDIGFFSQVEQTILDKMPNRATAEQVRGILNPQKTPGIKQDELDWLDIEAFLAENPRPTKDELLAYVRANNADVREVVKTTQAIGQLWSNNRYQGERDIFVNEHKNGSWNVWDADAKKNYGPFESADEAKQYAEDTLRLTTPTVNDTKFSQWQLEGEKSGYRELLLTLPPKADNWGLFHNGELVQDGFNSAADVRTYVAENNLKEKYTGRLSASLTDDSAAMPYKSSHFDEPNIVAHIRFNERTDADGAKVMFVEEVQSDWAQQGRKAGFQGQFQGITELPDGYAVKSEREIKDPGEISNVTRYWVENGDGVRVTAYSYNRESAINSAINDINDRARGTTESPVPNTPFKSTSAWSMLAFKRALRWAVENGFDKIAWTTGEQQAERYDLSKQVEQVAVKTWNDGTQQVNIVPIGGDIIELQVVNGEVVEGYKEFVGKSLEDVIGKDLAERVLTTPRQSTYTVFEGNDLTVGGEGMIGFYDNILPKAVNKYVKRFGGRVTTTTLNTTPDARTVKDTDSAYVLAAQSFQDSNGSVSVADLRSAYPDATENELRNAIDAVRGVPVHALDITPAMRESVMQGQPLFSKSDLRALARVEYASDLVDGVTSSITDDGHLNLSEHASEMVRRTLAELSNTNEQPFDGATITGNTLKRIARRLESFAADLDANGYDSKPVRELADNLKKTAGNNYSVLYVYEEALPEETVHVQDLNAGRTDAQALAKLKESPFWTNPGDKFTKQYPRISDADKASEIAAKLATDQASKYGWDKVADFETEKQKFLNEWANGIIRRNLDKLQTEDQWDDFTKSYPTITTYAGNKKSDTRASGKSGTTRPDTKAGQEKGTAEKGQEPVEGAESPSEEEARQEADRRLPADGGLKPRKTVTSLEERGYIAPGDITGENRYYKTISRDAAKAVAQERIERIGLSSAVAEAIQPAETVSSAEQAFRMEVAELLINQATELAETNVEAAAAKFNDAFDVIATLAVESTAYGQAISQLANWTRENPQTAVAYLARRRKRNNLDPLTPEQAAQIVEDARQVAEYKEQLDKANDKVADLEADVERLDTAIAEAQETVNTQKRTLTVLRRLYSYWKNKKGGTAKRQRKTVRERIAELEAKKADTVAQLRERFGTDVLKSVADTAFVQSVDRSPALYDRKTALVNQLTQVLESERYIPFAPIADSGLDAEAEMQRYEQDLTKLRAEMDVASKERPFKADGWVHDMWAKRFKDYREQEERLQKRIERLQKEEPNTHIVELRQLDKELAYEERRLQNAKGTENIYRVQRNIRLIKEQIDNTQKRLAKFRDNHDLFAKATDTAPGGYQQGVAYKMNITGGNTLMSGRLIDTDGRQVRLSPQEQLIWHHLARRAFFDISQTVEALASDVQAQRRPPFYWVNNFDGDAKFSQFYTIDLPTIEQFLAEIGPASPNNMAYGLFGSEFDLTPKEIADVLRDWQDRDLLLTWQWHNKTLEPFRSLIRGRQIQHTAHDIQFNDAALDTDELDHLQSFVRELRGVDTQEELDNITNFSRKGREELQRIVEKALRIQVKRASDDSILKSVADEPITDDVFEMLADLAELGILEDKPYTDLMAELADVTNGAIEPDVLSQAHSAAMARIEDEVQGRREKAQQAREADPELQAKYDALKATREIRKEHRQRAKDFLKATGQAVNTFERELMARAKAQNLPEYVVTAAMMFSDKSLSQADITRKLRERYPNEIKDGAAAMNAATKAAKFRSDVYKELRDERAAKRAEKNEASGEAQKAKQTYNNAFGKFRKRMEGLEKAPPSRVDRIIGIRKGLMVSALSTMWINVVGGAATSGLKTTSDIFTLALNKGLAQFGMESVAPDAIAAQVQFRELLGLDRDGKLGLDAVRQIFREARAAAHLAASHEFSDKTMSSRAQQVLNENPEWVDELFRAYNSDIEAHREVLRKSFKEAVGKEKIGAGVDAALDMAEYIADKANFLNRFQEFLIRNIEFDRALNVALANRGISLAKTIENKEWGNITGDDLAYAVRSALEVTYALRPKPGTAGATLVNLGKGTYKIPMMYVAPFANFIWNASRQVAQYTPGVGIAQKVLRSKNENKEVKTWTDAMKTLSPRDAANQIIGTSILIGIASMLRSIGSDDDDWKKIKVPFMTDQDGKQMYVDVGNWWPLTPFFWMANKINRTIDGKPLFSSDDPEEIAFEILEATVGINERTFDATVWKLVKSIPGAGSDVVSAAFTSSSLDGLLSKLATSSASDGDVAKVWYNFQKLGGEEIGIVTRPFKSFKDIAAFVDTFQKDGKENADLDLLDFPFEDAATKNVPFRNTIWQAAGAKPKKRVTGEDMQQPRGSIGGVEVTPALRIFGYNFTSDYRRKEPTPAIKKARSFMFEPKESDGLPESRRTSMWKGQIYRMIEDAGQDTDKQARVREIIDSAESRGMFTAQSADRMRSMVGKTPIQSAVVGVSRKQTGNKPSPFNQVLALANETELTELLRMVTAKLIAEQTKREMSAADDDPTKPKKPKKPSATIMELEKEQQTIMGEIERRKKE